MAWSSSGTDVGISKSASSSILFAKGSTVVHQYVETTTVETRGLTQSAANGEAGIDDDTTQTVYYGVVDGDVETFVATTGTKITKTATRANEANGWIVTTTTETYSTSLADGQTLWQTACSGTGTAVSVSKQISSSLLFSKTGSTPIYQVETETTTEYRGAGSASLNSVVFSDNTTSTTYYASIDGETYSFTATSGTRTTWSAIRQNGGNWTATKREVTYSISPSTLPNIWGTTKIDADGNSISKTSSGTSSVVSIEKSATYLATFLDYPLVTTVTTETTEYKYVDTKAHAESIVSSNTATCSTEEITTPITYDASGNVVGGYATSHVKYGVEKYASARYVSDKEGWTVTVVKKTYGWEGTDWRLAE